MFLMVLNDLTLIECVYAYMPTFTENKLVML